MVNLTRYKGQCTLRFVFLKKKMTMVRVKVKQSHIQAWTGPEGSRRLRLLDFKTIGT